MNPFTKGDKVVRTGPNFCFVKTGKTYTVHGITGDGYISLQEVIDAGVSPTGGSYEAARFKAAEVAKVKPVKGSKRDYVADHARRTLRVAGFSKEVAKELVAELQHQNAAVLAGTQAVPFNSVLQRAGLLNRDGTFNLSAISRKLPVGKQTLVGAISWADTKRGFAYWDKVFGSVAN